MGRINIIPASDPGPDIMGAIASLLAGFQQGKQRTAAQREKDKREKDKRKGEPPDQGIISGALSRYGLPTARQGTLLELTGPDIEPGQGQSGQQVRPQGLLANALSPPDQQPPSEQQWRRNISATKDEVSDLEDDLKEITRQIDENKFTESRFPPAQLQAMTRTQEKLKEMLGYARGNRQAAYGGNASTRSARQQYTDRRKQTPGGYEPAPADWQPPTRAAQAPNPARSGQAKKPIPRAVAAEIFKQAGNDPTRAAQMAEERGYDPRRFAD